MNQPSVTLRRFRSMRFGIAAVSSIAAFATILASSSFFPVTPAKAVPAFTDQTGQPCQACHVGGFGPQLTPFGREFKLGGYTMRAKASIPVSAMAIASFTHTRADQNPPPDRFKANDNFSFDQGSLFVAGGAGQHFGGFAQITYDGVAKHWSWDNLDIRAVTTGHVFGQDAIFGLTLNNSPTVQDVWNTTPAWGFPYTDTTLSQTPGAAPLIDGGLAQGTLGLSAYSWIGHKFYLEAGGYVSPSAETLSWLGSDPESPGSIHGIAPYGRIAFQHELVGGTFEAGAFALKAAIYPGRDQTSGYTDHYSDVGVDASWLKQLGSSDTIAVNARYIHESSNLQASCALALIGDGSDINCARTHLNEIRGDVTYNWRNKVGLTLGGFSTTGSSNANLYEGPNASPNSDGVMAQLDYTPWGAGNSPLGKRANMRVGVQYTAYGKFDGARHNYDGAGANAADNNVLRVFTWVAF
jgi:hypothetical protein